MTNEKHETPEDKNGSLIPREETDTLTNKLLAGKNLWLTKIRWLYSFFILAFFFVYNTLAQRPAINYRTLLLILGLSALGNIIFIMAINRGIKYPSKKYDKTLYTSMGAIQLDFDLVILSLLTFFSGGFDSPILVMYIFYIMVGTFLIHYRKAFRNTLTAIILVAVIFLSHQGLVVSSQKLTTLVAFDVILIFAFLISSYLSKKMRENEKKIQELLEKTHELSITDGLTGLYNQAHFILLLKLQLEKSKRYGTAFSVIIFDVDHFKCYNDHNGHLKGSEALRLVAELSRGVFRASDSLAKYGGDEFVIILPTSDRVGAFLAADRLRELIETEKFEGEEHQPKGKITISMGIASYPEHADTIEGLMDKADKALYASKNSGRNKVLIYGEETVSADLFEQQSSSPTDESPG